MRAGSPFRDHVWNGGVRGRSGPGAIVHAGFAVDRRGAGRELLRFRNNDAPEMEGPRRTVLFTPDGTCLVILGGDMRVRAWDLGRGTPPPLPSSEEDAIGNIALSHGSIPPDRIPPGR